MPWINCLVILYSGWWAAVAGVAWWLWAAAVPASASSATVSRFEDFRTLCLVKKETNKKKRRTSEIKRERDTNEKYKTSLLTGH